MNKGNELFHTHTYLFIHVAGDAQGRRRHDDLQLPDQVPAACVTTARGPTANDRGLDLHQAAFNSCFVFCVCHSRCCRSTGFANRRWALLLLTRRPLRVFVRRSLLTPDGPCLSVWVQSLACGVFVRRALRTPDGPFLIVWVQNLACGVCVCVILGVSVCVSFSVWLCCVCCVVCGCVLCFAAPGALAAWPTW